MKKGRREGTKREQKSTHETKTDGRKEEIRARGEEEHQDAEIDD